MFISSESCKHFVHLNFLTISEKIFYLIFHEILQMKILPDLNQLFFLKFEYYQPNKSSDKDFEVNFRFFIRNEMTVQIDDWKVI